MVNVFDVVKYILSKMKIVTAMKLQKLAYYCQAWSIVWDGKALFDQEIEAWANGPVVRELYDWHKGMYEIKCSDLPNNKGNISNLTKDQKETIDAVLDYYGGKSPQWLSDLAHSETPWQVARKGLPEGERGNSIISRASLEEYYSSLDEDS